MLELSHEPGEFQLVLTTLTSLNLFRCLIHPLLVFQSFILFRVSLCERLCSGVIKNNDNLHFCSIAEAEDFYRKTLYLWVVGKCLLLWFCGNRAWIWNDMILNLKSQQQVSPVFFLVQIIKNNKYVLPLYPSNEYLELWLKHYFQIFSFSDHFSYKWKTEWIANEYLFILAFKGFSEYSLIIPRSENMSYCC